MNLLKEMFPFPSNGKADPKAGLDADFVEGTRVSIPFKRESLSKVNTISVCEARQYISFNSLQTGKPIQSRGIPIVPDKNCDTNGFQFPSNGKAYPKMEMFGDKSLSRWDAFQFPSNGKAYPKITLRYFPGRR